MTSRGNILFLLMILTLFLTGCESSANTSVSISETVIQNDWIETGKNLFDPMDPDVAVGYFVNQVTGDLDENPAYVASGWIPVTEGTSYTRSFPHSIAWYDADRTYLSGTAGSPTPSPTAIAPNGAAFCRCTFSAANYNTTGQFEAGETATAYEPFGYRLVRQLPPEDTISVEIALPDTVYGLVGQELNIYFDNILSDQDTRYDFVVDCNIGGHYDTGYRVVPQEGEEGRYALTIQVWKDRQFAVSEGTVLKVAPADAGSGITRSILVIGDSTTANGTMLSKLYENFAQDPMDITLLGTLGDAPVFHEGRSGWTTEQYFQDAESPFVFHGIFDFGQYMMTQMFDSPDYVLINLGINDVFSCENDAALEDKVQTMLTQYQGMIDSIHDWDPDIRIGLCVTIPPAYDQDSFGKAYGCRISRWRCKLNNFVWTDALIHTFTGQEDNNVYLIPINTNLDTRYNMGLESLPVNARSSKLEESTILNGACHPDEAGYWQIADAIWYFLKNMETS